MKNIYEKLKLNSEMYTEVHSTNRVKIPLYLEDTYCSIYFKIEPAKNYLPDE